MTSRTGWSAGPAAWRSATIRRARCSGDYGYDLRGLQLFARFDGTSGEGLTNVYDASAA